MRLEARDTSGIISSTEYVTRRSECNNQARLAQGIFFGALSTT